MSQVPLRLEWIHPSEIRGNPANWRRHPELQRDALEALLYGEDPVGWAGAALLNERRVEDGWSEEEAIPTLIDGHLRREVGAVHDDPVPTLIGSWSPEKERKILATLDPIAALAEADREALGSLLQSVQTSESSVQALLGELAEREGVVFGNGQEPEPIEPQVNRSQELKEVWGTALGQVWELGKHRLVCGDCTDLVVIEAVMRGEKIQSIVTDPPYGIGHDLDYTRFTGGIYGTKHKEKSVLVGDDSLFDPSPYLIYETAVIWGANAFSDKLPLGTWLVWDKRFENGTAFLSDGEVAWMKGGHGVYIYSLTSQGFVRPEPVEHPTQKPVDLIIWCIERSKAGEVIYDPFLGSGTTLIACQNLNRKCRGIEISPAYCAVAIQRWVDMTGLEPRRVE